MYDVARPKHAVAAWNSYQVQPSCVLVIALYGTIIVCMSLIEGCSISGVKKGLLCPCPGAIGHLTRRPLLIYSQRFGR